MLQFFVQTILISMSGVMAPGPMTAATAARGGASPHAGALIAVGHGIVEFPLMAIIYLGFGYFFNNAYAQAAIAGIGGAVLLYMAAGMLRNLNRPQAAAAAGTGSAVGTGVTLSLINPYFLVWWATVGAALIMKASKLGLAVVAGFAVVHWLCDFVWLYFLSGFSYKGGKMLGRKFQTVVLIVCGIALLAFGGKFLFDAGKAAMKFF